MDNPHIWTSLLRPYLSDLTSSIWAVVRWQILSYLNANNRDGDQEGWRTESSESHSHVQLIVLNNYDSGITATKKNSYLAWREEMVSTGTRPKSLVPWGQVNWHQLLKWNLYLKNSCRGPSGVCVSSWVQILVHSIKHLPPSSPKSRKRDASILWVVTGEEVIRYI